MVTLSKAWLDAQIKRKVASVLDKVSFEFINHSFV
jgi:hypothetical protein